MAAHGVAHDALPGDVQGQFGADQPGELTLEVARQRRSRALGQLEEHQRR